MLTTLVVIQVLRRPCAQLSADDVEDRDVADVRRGKANADDVRAEKFLRADPGEPESNAQPDLCRAARLDKTVRPAPRRAPTSNALTTLMSAAWPTWLRKKLE